MINRILYPIAPSINILGEWYNDYFPGILPSGDQMIIVPFEPIMYAFKFDYKGQYIDRIEKQITGYDYPSEIRMTIAEQQAESRSREAKIRQAISSWANELGLQISIVKIRKFNSRTDGINGGSPVGPSLALYDYPHYFDGDLGDQEEREKVLQEWHDRGAFVLMWYDHEYTLDRDGRLFS